MENTYENSRNAAKITLEKISSWEDLNAAILEEGNEKFSKETKELWKDFAVHGMLRFDKKEGKQVLDPFTDLDGKCAIGILKESGIDISKLAYVRPGEHIEGAINLDTGNKLGVVYEESTYTTYFDHHAPGTKEVTSATEIVYKTMVDLGMTPDVENMKKLVDFVTKIDNRKFPAEEFLSSAKTILGLQRELDFDRVKAYFEEHESPTEELTPSQLEKYGLKESAEKQQKLVDESMITLDKMEQEGKFVETKYGKVLINLDNELKVGSPAAYVKFDGIINLTPGKSFMVSFKEEDFNEKELKERLGDKFQGIVIRGKMWLYNDKDPLNLSMDDLISAIK